MSSAKWRQLCLGLDFKPWPIQLCLLFLAVFRNGAVHIKTVFPKYGIPMLKVRRSGDRLIFNMGSLYWCDDIFILRRPPGHKLSWCWPCSPRIFRPNISASATEELITMRCRYSAISFLQHSQTPRTAHPWWRDIGCLLWVRNLMYVLPLSVTALSWTITRYSAPRYNHKTTS